MAYSLPEFRWTPLSFDTKRAENEPPVDAQKGYKQIFSAIICKDDCAKMHILHRTKFD